MINDVRGIENNDEYVYLKINNAIDLIIFKKIEKDRLKFKFDFNAQALTQKEAEEIIDYFILTESENIL